MYARAAPERQLANLLERGFTLSISEATLEEVWAHSALKDKRGLLFTRAKTLEKYLNPKRPVTPIGLPLKRRIHPLMRTAAHRRGAAEHSTQLLTLWRAVVSGQVSDDDWRRAGRMAEDDMGSDEWVLNLNKNIGKFPELASVSERDAVAALRRSLAKDTGTALLQERTHAYASVFALRCVRSAKGMAGQLRFKSNDSVDTQLLMQVGLPAFFATQDRALLRDVDASGTYQAPWVRTIEDLLVAELPDGVPWGPGATRAARAFQRSAAAR